MFNPVCFCVGVAWPCVCTSTVPPHEALCVAGVPSCPRRPTAGGPCAPRAGPCAPRCTAHGAEEGCGKAFRRLCHLILPWLACLRPERERVRVGSGTLRPPHISLLALLTRVFREMDCNQPVPDTPQGGATKGLVNGEQQYSHTSYSNTTAPCTMGAHRALCPRCAKSRLSSTAGSHGSQGPEFRTPDAALNGSCTLL